MERNKLKIEVERQFVDHPMATRFVLGETSLRVAIAAFAASCPNFKKDLPQDDGSSVGFASLLSEVSDLDAARQEADDGAEGRQRHWERRFPDEAVERSLC
jgi:hypothetical protein